MHMQKLFSGKNLFILAAMALSLSACKNGGSNINDNNSDYKGGNKVIRIAEVMTPLSIFPT